ncbi:hypothetical protein [Streptomyces triculaminicus]
MARRIGVTAHRLRKAAYAHPVTVTLMAKAQAEAVVQRDVPGALTCGCEG